MSTPIKIALLDLYNGTENEGMRCIRELLSSYPPSEQYSLSRDEFDVRQYAQIPDLSYDIYISSGGPGSPLASPENQWECGYFNLLSKLQAYNNDPSNSRKKSMFFICHSFQLACRFFQAAEVSKRKSMAFGVFPIHPLKEAINEPVFAGLDDPFYAVDSRYYQILNPDHTRIEELGGKILCVEKERPHVPLERAIMAMRFNDYMIGTQFHPEVDAEGMRLYLLRDENKQTVINNHGQEKWENMLEHLDDPDKIRKTYSHILPNFINQSIRQLLKDNYL